MMASAERKSLKNTLHTTTNFWEINLLSESFAPLQRELNLLWMVQTTEWKAYRPIRLTCWAADRKNSHRHWMTCPWKVIRLLEKMWGFLALPILIFAKRCSKPEIKYEVRYVRIFSEILLTCKKPHGMLFFEKMEIYLKANLLKGRDAKPEGAKVRKSDHVSRLLLFPYIEKTWERKRFRYLLYYMYMDVWV